MVPFGGPLGRAHSKFIANLYEIFTNFPEISQKLYYEHFITNAQIFFPERITMEYIYVLLMIGGIAYFLYMDSNGDKC